MDFDSIEDLYNYVESAHVVSATVDTPKVIKEVEKDVIDEEVYSKYSPNLYSRRKGEGGLGDTNNMITQTNFVGDEIFVKITNETSLNPPEDDYTRDYRLDENIEYGGTYEYISEKKEPTYMKPRPFTERTMERLMVTKEHEKAYKEGMKVKGIDLE